MSVREPIARIAERYDDARAAERRNLAADKPKHEHFIGAEVERDGTGWTAITCEEVKDLRLVSRPAEPGEERGAMNYIMRRPVRSAMVLLTGVMTAVIGAGPADAAGMVRTAAPPVASSMDGLIMAPSLSILAELNGVFCTSPGNCWAVGFQPNSGGNATVNQVLRWNGSKWRPFPVPEPAGTARGDYNALTSVRCLTARDCWAVGTFDKGFANLDQVLHWNGKKWSDVRAPAPGGTVGDDMNELSDVTCVSAADCWAVGFFGSFINNDKANQVLHWNGKKWSLVSTPDPAGTATGEMNILAKVRCSSASACLADGQYGTATSTSNEVLRWNGKKWSHQVTPNPAGTAMSDVNELLGLACSSSASCWAAGADGKENLIPSVNEILHWNDKKWSTTKVPNPATGTGAINALDAGACLSARDCWAVGGHGHDTTTEVIRNDTLHWNGTKWSHVSSPNPGSTTNPSRFNVLSGIRCTSAANCWAVGAETSGNNLVDEILHWNGMKWVPVSVAAGGAA